MIIRSADPNSISAIITEFLGKKSDGSCKPLFVFSSDVAVDSWTEWAVRNSELSGVQAVALEEFTAWDKFKGNFLAGNVTGKNCIPSLLRKLYVRSLIHQNLEQHFIKKIVPSDSAESAYAFTDWLSKILPSLKLWHQKYVEFLAKNNLTEQTDPDLENQDYNQIFTRYNNFLEENNLFEPSWLNPEFVEKERTIIIFYPEILEDFSDYEAVFSKAQNVIAVKLPEAGTHIETEADVHTNAGTYTGAKNPVYVYKYQDSRKELRHTILRLRKLHEQGIKWTEMAVNVPDLDVYRPYIRREFELYCVPVNIRSGEPLTKNCAGLIFTQLNECFTSNFSYSSVRALLQNEYVPWKEDLKEVRENLILEGNRMRAICSYEENENSTKTVDIWKESLSAVATDERESRFYEKLKKRVTEICRAENFKKLRAAWFTFRDDFLQKENFTSDANKILGRCLSELDDLIDIENRFLEPLALKSESPFSFYLNEINSKTYRPQEKLNGVSVFSYRLAAQAHFKYQFIIDASQKNLDVPNKRLSFLNNEKRKLLLGANADEKANSSEAFVRLYAKDFVADLSNKSCNFYDSVHFSYAEETFAGFAIAHSALTVANSTDEPDNHCKEFESALEKYDFIKLERENLCKNGADGAQEADSTKCADDSQDVWGATCTKLVSALNLSVLQKEAAQNWANRLKNFNLIQNENITTPLQQKITEVLVTNRKSDSDFVVTQTDLAKFYPCPRKWILSSILKIKAVEDSLDTNLMQNFDMGNINHKILELFMKDHAAKKETLPVTNQDGIFENEAQITKKIEEYVQTVIHSRSMDFKDSPLVIRVLESQATLIRDGILKFLHEFCKDPDKPEPEKINSRSSIHGFGGYTVVGAEVEIASEIKEEQSIKLFGKIDCLLCSDDGDYVIIDYKNTSFAMPKAADICPDENGLLGDFQMPMYVTLVNNEKIPQGSTIKVEAAYFYSIKEANRVCAIDDFTGLTKNSDSNAVNLKKYQAFCTNTIPLFNDYTKDFVERVKSAKFEPVIPQNKNGNFVHVEPYSVCVKCSFKDICRTTFTVGEKEVN